MYKELISCPLVLTLGEFWYLGYRGYITLPVLNLRLSLLRDERERVHVVNNIPFSTWANHVYGICSTILLGDINKLELHSKIEAITMFYGGLGIYSVFKDNIVPVTLDFVNKKKFYFYLCTAETFGRHEEAKLEDWLMFQLALREGFTEFLPLVCSRVGNYTNRVCVVKTSHGLLKIAVEELDHEGCIRIYPDNAPLRHVIALEQGFM